VPTTWFSAAEGPFQQLLDQMRPQAVLVLGVRLWRSMLEGQREGLLTRGSSLDRYEDRYRTIYSFPLGVQGKAYAMHVPHPSSGGFLASAWTPLIQAFLTAVREREHPCRC
jgi:uracil-DNA glycosylase